MHLFSKFIHFKEKFHLVKSTRILLKILIIFLVVLVFLITASFYLSSYYRKAGDEAVKNKDYQSAQIDYKNSLNYRDNGDVSKKLKDVELQLTYEKYYFDGIKLLKSAKNKEEYQKTINIFNKIPKTSKWYDLARKKIAFAGIKIAEIVKKEEEDAKSKTATTVSQDESSNNEESQVEEENVVEESSDQSSRNDNTTDNCTYETSVGHGEFYDGVCISGNDAFRQKVKDGFNYLRNKSSYFYGLMRDHTRMIGQNLEADGGICQDIYDQYFAGFQTFTCTYCSSNGGKGLIVLDPDVTSWSNSNLAGILLHEALHSMPGMCTGTSSAEVINNTHEQMRQNWENEYDAL